MTIEVRVPMLPESVSDAQLVSWQKQVGDAVSRDDNLVEIETDKVVLEVPAPGDGVITQIVKEDGSMVTSDELIAVIDPNGKAEAAPATSTAEAEPAPPAEETAPASAPSPTPAPAPATAPPPAAVPAAAANLPLSPAVRRLVNQHQLDASQIPATGRDGRLTKGDVLNFIKAAASTASAPAAAATSAPATPAAPLPAGAMPPPPPLPTAAFDRGERREQMSRLRARIAERLVEAQHTAAILTTFNEVDLHEVMSLRSRLKDKFEERHGARLGFMSFFVKAAVEALQKFPIVNASVEGDEIVYHDYYDIGIAVSSPRGLVVPVLRDADELNFAQVESTIADFGKRARDGSLGIDELTGGTFSITNGGVFGSLLSTPILNPPQSAILGMHKIQQRPMAVNGEVVVRPMMYLALSYDHRIIDGRDAVQFLVAIKESLEDPAKLMLNI